MGNVKDLYSKIDECYTLLNNIKNSDEKLMYIGYIKGLYQAIKETTLTNNLSDNLNDKISLEDYLIISNRFALKRTNILENFIKNKDFYYNFITPILLDVDKTLKKANFSLNDDNVEFSEEEYYNIYHGFMKSLKLEWLFDEIINGRKIYKTFYSNNKNANAYLLYNPLNRDYGIFIKNFKYNVKSMHSLSHETGHLYELLKNNFTALQYMDYNNYNQEVISTLFERLYLNYMFENNIKIDAVKNTAVMSLYNKYQFLANSYILTLLEDDYLRGNKKNIQNKFSSCEIIYNFIKNYNNNTILNNNKYVYGDIISMFLEEAFLSSGGNLNNKLTQEFFSYRDKISNRELIKKLGIEPNTYLEMYKNHIQFIKSKN